MSAASKLPIVIDGVHSGDRLKVAYFQQGITAYPGGLVDEELGEQLVEPRLAADGKTRALPRFTDAASGYFIEAACTVPLYVRLPDAALPKYLTIQEASGAHVYAAGSLPAPGSVYYMVGGSCMSRGLPGGLSGLQYFAPGLEAPLEGFAELSVSRGQ